MGPLYYKQRTQNSLSFPSYTDLTSPGNSTSSKSRKKGSVGKGDRLSARKGSSRGGSSTNGSRPVFSYVYGNKEIRGMEASHGLKTAEPKGGMPPLQNGDRSIHKVPFESGGMGGVRRSVGRLPPPFGSPELPQVSTHTISGQESSVQSNVLWTVNSTPDIYSSHESRSSVSQEPVDPDTYVSGRLAHSSRQSCKSDQGRPDSLRQDHSVRLDNKPEKVRVGAHSTLYLSGHDNQPESGHCPSNTRGSSEDKVMVPVSQTLWQSDSKILNELPGSAESCSRHDPTRKALPKALTMVPKVLLGEGEKSRVSARTPTNLLSPPGMVGKGGSFGQGSSLTSSQSATIPFYGCQQGGMGSVPGGGIYQWNLVAPGSFYAYQLPRNVGHYPFAGSLSGNPFRQVCVSPLGQHNSSVTHKEARGNAIPQAMCAHQTATPNSSGQECVTTSSFHPGKAQCAGGPTFSVRPNHPIRMDAFPPYFPQNTSAIPGNQCRPVCNEMDQTATTVRISSPRQASLGDRRPINELGQPQGICLSSNKPDQSGSGPGAQVHCNSGTGSSTMAKTAMVSNLTLLADKSPDSDTNQSQTLETAHSREVPLVPERTQSSRVAIVRSNLLKRGFSQEVAERAGKPQRKSSLNLYQSRWKKFLCWCSERGINSDKANVSDVADFLLHLHNDKNCSISTITGYRTAISQTLSFVNGAQVGMDPVLTNLIKNLKISRPPRVVKAPEWDLNLVLDALRKPPFEPPRWDSSEHKKLTTYKTVFLLALATGARRSEIHAFSRHPRDLVFGRKGVSIRTKTEFLAKNQIPDHDPGPFFVKSLDLLVGRRCEESLLCPVRMLRLYLDFTKGADNNGPLFVKLSDNGLPKSQTISNWLKKCIQLIYTNAGQNVSAHAHEVRRMAASWAFHSGVNTTAIIEAGRWRSNTSFTSYYLTDVQLQRDGFYRPVSCMVMGSKCRI